MANTISDALYIVVLMIAIVNLIFPRAAVYISIKSRTMTPSEIIKGIKRGEHKDIGILAVVLVILASALMMLYIAIYYGQLWGVWT